MPPSRVGPLIRERREQAHRSQMHLALDAGVSPRHLSFVELGKSRPSPELVELLGERLGLPLRERNEWLLAAGYAPVHPETPLGAGPLDQMERSLQALLDAHDPFPALVVDRRWTVQLTNAAGSRIATGIPLHARGEPSNIFRISLHPDGFAGRTTNFDEWAAYLLAELDATVARTRDRELTDLAAEIETWPRIPPRSTWARPRFETTGPVISWKIEVGGHHLDLFTTLSVFAAPMDVTLSELAVEMFFAADSATADALRRLAAG